MKELAESRILIVDDVKTNVDILVQALRDDYKLGVALDGDTALRSIEKSPPDLVLLDIVMPGIDGYEVCRRLRAEENPAAWQLGWEAVGKAWNPFVTVASVAMTATEPIPAGATNVLTRAGRAILGSDRIPMVSNELPGGG